jgi:hypothetical protein
VTFLSVLSLAFTIRFLATDLSQSHGNFKYHCNYSTCRVFNSWHSLIPSTADSLNGDLLLYDSLRIYGSLSGLGFWLQPRVGPQHRKHVHCLATNVLYCCVFLGTCSLGRRLAMGMARSHKVFCCCVRVLWSLPSNRSTLMLAAYLLRACLLSRCLAMSICVTVFFPVYTVVTDIKAMCSSPTALQLYGAFRNLIPYNLTIS